MNFRKQSDGLSWLITEPDGDGVRKLAVVTINESLSEPHPEIQMIDATADEEIAVRETAQKILTLQAHLWVDPAPNGRFGSGI